MLQTKEQVVADQFTLDVVQASEIKYAAERNNVTNADLKVLSSGDVFAQILPVLRGYGKVVVSILEFVGEMVFPGATRFVARDNFLLKTRVGTGPKISHLGESFKVWFSDKVETNISASTLSYGKLVQSSVDVPIIQSLGGEDKVEISLAEVFHSLSLQPNGEEGDLLTNGWANIFYVRDVNGVLRAVSVNWWCSDGWNVGANATSNPYEWSAGGRVFSRKQVSK